jgi:hypothetical protein
MTEALLKKANTLDYEIKMMKEYLKSIKALHHGAISPLCVEVEFFIENNICEAVDEFSSL